LTQQGLEKEAEEAERLVKVREKKVAAESERRDSARFHRMDNSVAASPLRGKDLKVIVKVS
jgi:hypothetical protein